MRPSLNKRNLARFGEDTVKASRRRRLIGGASLMLAAIILAEIKIVVKCEVLGLSLDQERKHPDQIPFYFNDKLLKLTRLAKL